MGESAILHRTGALVQKDIPAPLYFAEMITVIEDYDCRERTNLAEETPELLSELQASLNRP